MLVRLHKMNSLFPALPPFPSKLGLLQIFSSTVAKKIKSYLKYFFEQLKTGFVGIILPFCGQNMAKILLLKIKKIKSSPQKFIR